MKKLKTLRKKMGLTQAELAQEIGVSGRALNSWECGQRWPKIEDAIKLAEFFGCTLDELVRG